jgi:hypothetical protein
VDFDLPTGASTLFVSLNEVGKGSFQGLAPPAKLYQIETPLAALKLADFGLCLLKPCSQFDLAKSGRLSGFPEKQAECLVFAAERGFFHGTGL